MFSLQTIRSVKDLACVTKLPPPMLIIARMLALLRLALGLYFLVSCTPY